MDNLEASYTVVRPGLYTNPRPMKQSSAGTAAAIEKFLEYLSLLRDTGDFYAVIKETEVENGVTYDVQVEHGTTATFEMYAPRMDD